MPKDLRPIIAKIERLHDQGVDILQEFAIEVGKSDMEMAVRCLKDSRNDLIKIADFMEQKDS